MGAALVLIEPAALDRKLEAGDEFGAGRVAAVPREKWRVDLLDADAAVLDRFDGSGELEELGIGDATSRHCVLRRDALWPQR
ncbi:hypothetical protein ACRQ5Q_22735 [Bradyrhizobium sp. PMVTL-01]|uniref:hypothetical protein n=1 Tax=unclassified Bradyrhizobium TaxID=2631580 RepID=UPI003F710856